MRENRETSELTAGGSGAARPEQAESRTTGASGTDTACVKIGRPPFSHLLIE